MDLGRPSSGSPTSLPAPAGGYEAAVTAAAHEQADLMAKSIVERERTKSQIFAILTDEQKAKLAAQKAEFDKKREEFKARRQAPKAADAPTN